VLGWVHAKEVLVTWNKLLAGVAIWLIAVAACAHAGPAQDVLADLASSARADRVASGVVSIGAGVAIGVASAALLGADLAPYGFLAGGVTALPGVLLLLVPSAAELEYEEAGKTETGAALALQRLADEGRRSRYISAIGNLAAGVAALAFPVNLFTPYDWAYSAVASLGMAAYDYLVPSREEAAYERYLQLAEVAATPASP